MGKREQQKGRRAEIELSSILNEHGLHTRPGAPVSFGGEPDIVGIFGIHAEIKRRENPDISAALKQAQMDSDYFGDGIPAVFSRGNRQAWRVTMTLENWLKLYEGEVNHDAPGEPTEGV